MASQWFVFRDQRVQGPFTPQQIKSMAGSGEIGPATLLRSDAAADWKEACDFAGLFPEDNQVVEIPQLPLPPELPPLPGQPASAPDRTLLYVAMGGGSAVLVASLLAVAAYFLTRSPDADPAAENPAVAQAEDADTEADTDNDLPAEKEATEEPEQKPSEPDAGESKPDEPVDPQEPPKVVEVAAASKTEPPQESLGVPGEAPEPVAAAPRTARPPRLARPALNPKPLLPPAIPEKTPVTDSDITAFNRRVALERTASDAYGLYLRFLQSHDLTDDQLERAQVQLDLWKSRADEGLARLGGDWVAPDKVEEARQAALDLISRAETMVQANSYRDAIGLLEEASKANPNGIRPDYILGLLYSLPRLGPVGAEEAEKYFRNVLRRVPDDAGALNSLAITLIKQHEIGSAASYFERAAELSAEHNELIQNTGRFLHLARTGRISASRGLVTRFEKLHEGLKAESEGEEFDPDTGWLHIIPLFPHEEQDGVGANVADTAGTTPRMRLVGSGTGFIVAPGFVLTNRSAIESSTRWGGSADYGIADEVRVTVHADGGTRDYVGGVVAVSDDLDLALVELPGMDGRPVSFRDEPVAIDVPVMAMGFPARSLLGGGLKAAQATIEELPNPAREGAAEYLMINAGDDHKTSGGPLFDSEGRVAGLLTRQFNPEAKLSCGVPAEGAADFVRRHVPQWDSWRQSREEIPSASDWGGVSREWSESVVEVKSLYEAGVSALAAAGERSTIKRDTFEDYTCPNCSGLSWLPCPQRGCAKGRVSRTIYENFTPPGSKAVVRVPKVIQEVCPTCGGADRLDCRACQNGLDQALLGQGAGMRRGFGAGPGGMQNPGIPPPGAQTPGIQNPAMQNGGMQNPAFQPPGNFPRPGMNPGGGGFGGGGFGGGPNQPGGGPARK